MSVRRAIRIVAIGFAALTGAVAIALLALFGAAQTDFGRYHVARLLETILAGPGETVRIGTLEGSLPVHVRARDVALADGRGTWLELDELRFDWSIASIVRGELRLRELALAGVRYERSSDVKGEPMSLPPFDVVVERLEVSGLTLGQTLVGETATLDVKGAATLARDAKWASLDLAVERRDAKGGHIKLRLAHARAPAEFTLDVDIAEPADGMVARLAGVAGAPAMSLRVTGDGPPSAWRGNIVAAVEGHGRFTSVADVAVGEGTSVRLAGEVGLQEVDPVLRPLLGSRIPLTLAFRWHPQRGVEIEHVRLDTGRLEAGGSGKLDLESRRLDAKAGLVVRDLPADPANGIPAIGRLSVDAVVVGPTTAPRVDLQLAASSVAAPQITAETLVASVHAQPGGSQSDALEFSGHGTIDGARTSLGALAPLVRERISWAVAGRRSASGEIAVSSLTLDAGVARVKAAVNLDSAFIAAEGNLDISVPDAAPLMPPGAPSVSGRVDVGVNFKANATGVGTADLRASFSPKFEGLPLDRVIGETARMTARVERQADRTIRFDVPGIEFGAGSAKLGGTVGGDFDRLDATFGAMLGDISSLAPLAGTDLRGRAQLDGTLRGSIEDLIGEAKLVASGVGIADLSADRVAAALSGSRRGDKIAGVISVDVEKQREIACLRAPVTVTDAQVEVRDFSLTHGSSVASGSVTMRRSDARVQGRVVGRADDLASLSKLTGLQASGAVRFAAEVAGTDTQRVNASITGRNLRFEEKGAAADAIDVSLQGRGRDPRSLAAQAHVVASGVRVGQVHLQKATIDAQGKTDDIKISGSIVGDAPRRIDLGFAAAVRNRSDDTRITLTQLDAKLGVPNSADARMALTRPATLALGRGSTTLDPVELAVDEGRIRISGKVAGQALAAEMSASSLPLRLARLVAPDAEFDGSVALDGRVGGTRSRPEARVDLSVKDVRAAGGLASRVSSAANPRLSGKLEAQLERSRLSLKARISGGAIDEVNVAGQVPVSVDPETLTPSLLKAGAIEFQINGNADVAGLIETIGGIDGDRVRGRLVANLRADGTVGSPRLNGQISLENGYYENVKAGTVINGLAMRVTAETDSLRLTTFTGIDGQGGTFDASGHLDLRPDQRFPFEFSLKLSGFRAVNRDEVSARLNGPLVVTGNLDRMAARGAIDVDGGEFRIPERLPGGIVTINVEEIGPPPPNGGPPGARKRAAGPAVDLDIWIRVPERFFVRGRGLTSDWKGAVHVGGSSDKPEIKGKIEANRGTLAFAGKTFTLTRAIIGFAGGKEPDPDLDVVAELKLRDVVATMAVSGKGSAPKIELRSDPPLPTEEIMSRILFNKSAGELSAVQAIQLADSVTTLTGAQSSGGMLDRLRSAAGLDVLTVEGGEGTSNGSALKAGKYLSNGVLVTVGQGTEPGSTKVGVEVELTRNLSVDTHLGGDAQGNVGINWKWDY